MGMMVTLWFLRRSRPVLLRDPKFLWFFKAGLDNLSHPSGSANAFHSLLSSGTFCQLLITFPISLDLHQIVGPDLNANSFNFWWLLIKVFWKQSFMIKKKSADRDKACKITQLIIIFSKKKIKEYHHICKQLEADQADNKKLLITYADLWKEIRTDGMSSADSFFKINFFRKFFQDSDLYKSLLRNTIRV